MNRRKYAEMTPEQIKYYIEKGGVFTTDQISIDQAIELFDTDKHFEYKSYFLLQDVIPKEYLSDQKFIESIIPMRSEYIYDSPLQYTTWEIKNKPSLVIDAIMRHGMPALNSLVEHAAYFQNPNEYTVKGELTNELTVIKSKLLENESFINCLIQKIITAPHDRFDDFDKQTLLETVVDYSEVYSKNDTKMIALINKYPETIAYYRGNDINQMTIIAMESRLQNRNFEPLTYNTKKLLPIIKKLTELDHKIVFANSIQKTIYTKALSNGLKKAKKELHVPPYTYSTPKCQK